METALDLPTPKRRDADRRAAESSAADDRRLLAPRLAALFAAGCLLFNHPVLGLFSRPVSLFGLPLLFVYLFATWALFIAVLAWLVESGGRRR